MKRSMIAPLTISAAAAICLAAAGPALAGPAATAPIKCKATVSNSHPAVNTTTVVEVRTERHAQVFTRAHYTTGTRLHYGTANNRFGRVVISYHVSGTRPGDAVVVDVTVVLGHQANSCSTSFTPKP
jgi:hypothetical protein